MPNDRPSHSTSASNAQAVVFTRLPLYQQIYVTDLVLGPAAAVILARKAGVDLARYDWWRVSLTPADRLELKGQAKTWQAQRAAEARAQAVRPDGDRFSATPWRKARNALGRAK
jgi:hypothetical protein